MVTVSHFNICCKTVRWYWKPNLRNGVQNPTDYSRSTIYFNNYESMWGLLHQIMWRKLCGRQAHCLCWNPYSSASYFLKYIYRGFQLFLDVLQMPSVAESFIQCDPVLQHSTEFSGLDATSADQLHRVLLNFMHWSQTKISFFQVTVSHHWETCKQVNKKSVDLHPRNTQ